MEKTSVSTWDPILEKQCLNQHTTIRKMLVNHFTEVVIRHPEHEVILEHWVNGVVTLVIDSEYRIQEEVSKNIHEYIMSPEFQIGPTENELQKRKLYLYAEAMLFCPSKVKPETLEQLEKHLASITRKVPDVILSESGNQVLRDTLRVLACEELYTLSSKATSRDDEDETEEIRKLIENANINKSSKTKENAVVNGEVSPAKKPRKTPPTPISKPATNIAPLVSPAPKAAPPPSQEDTPKLKIYKCGFCSFQSKDLNSVRLHMRVHIKPKTDEAKKTTVSTPSTPTAASAPVAQPTPPPQQNIVRKKLFRCQVCSASFVDRKSCLQHIKLTHSKASSSNKENEQSTATATSENTQPEEPMDTQTSDGGEESQPAEQESGDVTAAPTTEQPAEESKPQEGEGLDIEAMIAALHSDSATANSESININL
ncbi:hypothetical protein M8J75_002220 [Diaphorina citri]|nr:hypothetical protein M8J75_002220 [Diaphorina citri]